MNIETPFSFLFFFETNGKEIHCANGQNNKPGPREARA